MQSLRMEGYGGPAQPSPTIRRFLNGGYGWLEVCCQRCETKASILVDATSRPRNAPIAKLEAALNVGRIRRPIRPLVHLIERAISRLTLWCTRTTIAEWPALEKTRAQIQAVTCREQSDQQACSAKYGNGFQSFDFNISSGNSRKNPCDSSHDDLQSLNLNGEAGIW